MDKRPIGVFDSGLGGLTAVKELRRILPNEDIVYFGDTGRVPYGTRSDETIIKYARSDMDFLLKHNPKRVLIACGTVSTVALGLLKEEYSLPIDGVVEAAVAAAANATKNRRIGIMGTSATIRSGAYERLLRQKDSGIQTFSAACPLLVPLVENGRLSPDDVVISTVVSEYLADIKAAGVDALIMGCTHYPLLEPVVSAFMGEGVKLISPGREAASLIAAEMAADGTCNSPDHEGGAEYFVSDSVSGFSGLAETFLREKVTGSVSHVDIE
ncbi:MAG: glutamate racemase [Clostridia bacterium]|nr:glutamate racemase [Clostridia bacterium]